MQVISLSSLIEAGEESEVRDYLSSFSCSLNPGVENFLKNQAIESERRDFARTSLVTDEENNNDIIGYFTLMNKQFDFAASVSNSMKQRLAFSKHASSISTILIAQLGRADRYNGKVSGSKLLMLALENCEIIYRVLGMRIVCVEYEPIDKLDYFYSNNSFTYLQQNSNGNNLAFLRMS
ncbi:hypothetical protein ACI2OX_21590 [Bacillus sp. N9]